MNVVIVESPNKCKTIEKYLGKDFKVVASAGHIRDLPIKGLGIDIENNFSLTYDFIPDRKVGDIVYTGGEKRVERLKNAIKNAEKIYIATDPDREGEAIAWHIKECLELTDSEFERVTFPEITEDIVKESLNNTRGLLYEKVFSQETRRALDRLVGYLVSPVVTEILGTPVSAGRVQSPAVLLVVLREREIQKFKPIDHFAVQLKFDKKPKQWSANWDSTKFSHDENPYITDKDLVQKVADTKRVVVANCVQKTEYSSAPSPFSTSLLMQAASVQLGFSAKTTAKVTQALFEQGAISYHRTDSVNLSDECIENVRALAEERGYDLPEKPNKFKEKEGVQLGHEAIRPSNISDIERGLTDQEKAMYKLIWERTVASQLAKAEYNAVILELESEDKQYQFKAKSRTLSKKGWLVFGEDCLDDQEKEDDAGQVPVLEKGDLLNVEEGVVVAKKTQAPKRYTEASLIKKLEALGIGRPSTYASIMGTILGKGFVIEEKRLLKPTQLGESLVSSLMKAKFSFLDLNYSRELEEKLDQVEAGQANFIDVVSDLYQQLSAEILNAKAQGIGKPAFPCPKCQNALKKFKNRKTEQLFWVCQNQDCKHSMDDSQGKPVERVIHKCPKCDSQLRKFQNQTTKVFFWKCIGAECGHAMDDKKGAPVEKPIFPCPKCSTPLFRAKKATGDFVWVCPNKETECKVFFSDVNKKPLLEKYNCPKCKNELRRLNGENGHFWGCSNYKNGCKTSFPDKRGKPDFEPKAKVGK
ncbi:type I DNA topoisomerase [Acinetobacter baumannii]|nr:type I DNA topoisomerase [Acinetobacter baumannii]